MSNSAVLENSVSVGLQMIAATIEDLTEKSMLSRWLREYEAHKARKRRIQQVYEAITEGYDTLSEITAHTGISAATVRRIIIFELVSKNRVRSAKTKNANHRIEVRFEPATVLG